MNKKEYDEIDLFIDKKFNLTGAQLATLTQATTYTGIKEVEPKPKEHRGTTQRLDMRRFTVKDLIGKTPTDKTIWKLIQSKDLNRKIRDFFWKTMHMG